MESLKVWFPDYYTEAHRRPGTGQVLVNELAKLNIDCHEKFTGNCDFVLSGGTWINRDVRAKFEERQYRMYGRDGSHAIPVIQYCWDLYPFNIRNDSTLGNPAYYIQWWAEYLRDLAECKEVWVPSQCTVSRVKEFTGRDAVVMKTSVRTYEKVPNSLEPYVVDVMRKYPDRNRHAVKEACDELGIVCYETNSKVEWEEFKSLITNARLLVSAYEEASTGGLTLLEGYWHGVPVLCSNSPRNGAIDYFGDRAHYFQWDIQKSLVQKIAKLMASPPLLTNLESRHAWITQEYSEVALAQRIATRLRELHDA